MTNPNTGWSYHGSRWMMPQVARWTAPDPAIKGPDPSKMTAPWDLNPYSYVANSPTVFWDPTGQFEEVVHGDLIYKLAYAAGFSEIDAAKIAIASAAVDHNVETVPNGPGFSGKKLAVEHQLDGVTEKYHFASQQEALARAEKTGDHGDLRQFGVALHTLADVGFEDAAGPHMRGTHIFGDNVHGIYKTETMGWNFSLFEPGNFRIDIIDKAHADPVKNTKEFRKLFAVIKSAALDRGLKIRSNEAGLAAIDAVVDIKNMDRDNVGRLFATRPEGSTHSYDDWLKQNYDNGFVTGGNVKWSTEQKDY
jgi:RHS repeat-associated protein